MPPAGFEPKILVSERPQTHALDRTATGMARDIVHTIKRRKANWIGHILRRNCLLKHGIEGKFERRIEMTGRR
jgi:hypothetical protein